MAKRASQSDFFLNTAPDSREWDEFLKSQRGSWLQSFAWGTFQSALGRPVRFLQVRDRRKTIWAQILIIKLLLPFGQSILYSPLPYLFNPKASLAAQKEITALILQAIKKDKALLFRLDPAEEKTPFATQLYRSLGFLPSRKHLQPRETLILDLTPSTLQLFNNFKPKTRYNIRLAEKKGVETKISDRIEDLPIFLKLLDATAKREKIQLHPQAYYQKQFSTLAPRGLEKLFLAYYQRKPIAGILVSFFNDRATYLHGGSLREYRQLMAPHLLQWQAIQTARDLGCKEYDFWGIAPANHPSHPWAGITRFKLGFGGKVVSYLPAQELPLQPFWYKIYKLLRG